MLRSLNGTKLVVAANLYPPYTYLTTHRNGTSVFEGGIEVELLNSLKQLFNFQYDIVDCNQQWGNYINGTWTGVIGSVFKKKADLGIGGISVTYERSQAVQYSKIYLFSPITFITPANGLRSPVLLILEPFTITLWISILFALIFVIIFQKFIVHQIIKNPNFDITWPLISALLKQEKPKNFPTTTSLRLIYLFWSFACLIIGNYYAGCLYSIMTIPTGNSAIDTIKKLANQQEKGKIQVIVVEQSSYYKNFKTAKTGLNQKIGEYIKGVKSKNLGIEMVLKSKHPHAFVSSRDHLKHSMIKSPPNTFYLPPQSEDSTFLFDTMTMVLSKKFPYVQQFNYFISQMICSGIFEYWYRNEWHHNQVKYSRLNKEKMKYQSNNGDGETSNQQIEPLTNVQLQSAFYFLLIGVGVSILSVLIETNPFFNIVKKSSIVANQW